MIAALGVGGLELGGVEQQRFDDVGGRLGRPDRRRASLGDQIGQPPAVIEMGVAEDDRIDRGRIERQSLVV